MRSKGDSHLNTTHEENEYEASFISIDKWPIFTMHSDIPKPRTQFSREIDLPNLPSIDLLEGRLGYMYRVRAQKTSGRSIACLIDSGAAYCTLSIEHKHLFKTEKLFDKTMIYGGDPAPQVKVNLDAG